jgi:hypothetical protein
MAPFPSAPLGGAPEAQLGEFAVGEIEEGRFVTPTAHVA